MEILVGKNAGFCFGVSNAVTKTQQELDTYHTAYCLGELVHNKQVISKLAKQGLHIIDDISQAKSRVIIRAHGISKSVYQLAQSLDISLVDLTCPKVLQTHKIVKDYSQKGYAIIYLGISNHPETIGTISFSDNIFLVENLDDLDLVINSIKEKNISNILVLAQTTFSIEKFEDFTQKLKQELSSNGNLIIQNTICHATEARQQETEELAKKVEAMIIIGGKNSSNTQKLYDIASKNCPTIFIQDETELDMEKLKKYTKVGIMAGASTPKESINEVVKKLEGT